MLGAGALGFAAWAASDDAPDPGEPCDGATAITDPVWNDRREEVRAALTQANAGHAERAFVRVDAALSGYMARWGEGYRDACEATKVRRTQSETLYDLRMHCLDRGRVHAVTVIEIR